MARPTKREQINAKIGKGVSKMNEDRLNKLREAFSIDSTIEEACFYAGISEPTYYSWRDKNAKLFKGIEALRLKPILKARQEIVKGLINFDNSLKYLERKRKVEYSTRIESDLTSNGQTIYLPSEILEKNGITSNTKDNS